MAEVASLALGILPLGLQLVREVRDYLSAIEQRHFDLEAAATEIDILEHSLTTVDSVVSEVASIDDSTKDKIARVCDLVHRKIELVSNLISDIKTDAVVDKSLLDRAKARTKIILYPYKKENLAKLQTELRSLNTLLDTALRPLDYAFQKQLQSQTHAWIAAEIRQVESSIPKTSDIVVLAKEMAKRPGILAAAASQASVTSTGVASASLSIDTAVEALKRPEYPHRLDEKGFLCRCRPNNLTKRRLQSRGPLVLISEEVQESTHKPGCVFNKTQFSCIRRSYRLGWRFSGSDYLATVVALAINIAAMGRGQWSFSPSLEAFNHVSIARSPLVRLAYLYGSWTGSGRHPSSSLLCPASLDMIKRYWRCSFKWLLHKGKASPLDIDYRDGRTALHVLAKQHVGTDDAFYWETLQQLGIPNYILDRNGSSAWDHGHVDDMRKNARCTAWLLPADALLTQDTMASLGNCRTGKCALSVIRRVWYAVCHLDEFPDIMEDQVISPFLRTVISRSKDTMLRMLLEDSILGVRLREEFRAGQIAIAAADLIMLWFPSGAAALLDMHSRIGAPSEQASPLTTISTAAELPLLWTLVQGFYCSGQVGRPTEGYLDTIRSVLELDCAVPNALFAMSNSRVGNTWLSIPLPLDSYSADYKSIIVMCASHLADRRRRLTQLARDCLNQAELEQIGLVEPAPVSDILEGDNAALAWRRLLSKKVAVPVALNPLLGDRFLEGANHPWVYGNCVTS